MTFALLLDVSNYPHHIVQLEYFENAVRYSKFFEVFPDYLDPALISFMDARSVAQSSFLLFPKFAAHLFPSSMHTRGLHNSEAAVRSRLMYLFFKFVKGIKHRLTGKVEGILNGIYVRTQTKKKKFLLIQNRTLNIFSPTNLQDLLLLPDSNITIVKPRRRRLSQNSINGESMEKFNDQLQLFETVGLLISIDQVSDEDSLRYLTVGFFGLFSFLFFSAQLEIFS